MHFSFNVSDLSLHTIMVKHLKYDNDMHVFSFHITDTTSLSDLIPLPPIKFTSKIVREIKQIQVKQCSIDSLIGIWSTRVHLDIYTLIISYET